MCTLSRRVEIWGIFERSAGVVGWVVWVGSGVGVRIIGVVSMFLCNK